VLLLGLGVVLLLLPLVQEREWHGSAKWLLAEPSQWRHCSMAAVASSRSSPFSYAMMW